MISQCSNSERSLLSSLGRILDIWSQNTLKLLYTLVTGAGLERVFFCLERRHLLEIGWTDPGRLHDAISEWRGRVTITGYC